MNIFRSPKPPSAPNYTELAQQQGAENQRAAISTAQLGSPNENTPWGSINRTYDPSTNQFTYTTTLTEDQQRLLDGGEELDLARMDLGAQQIGNLSELWSKPFSTEGMTERVTSVQPSNLRTSYDTRDYTLDPGSVPGYQSALDLGKLGNRPTLDFNGLPSLPGAGDFGAERQRVEDALYQQQTSRLDPQWKQREEALRDRLYSQGIREGHPAWTEAFEAFNRERNDAYQGARSSSIAGAGAEQSRLFGMASTARQQAATEALATAGFGLDARSQGVAEALASGNFANTVATLERQYGLERQAAINMATQLQNTLEMQEAAFNNTAEGQRFDEGMANALLANRSRGEELDEAAFQRRLPFEEFSAITSGTGVTQPNFSGPTVAPGVQGAPLYQAGQDSYQAQYNVWLQKMNQLNEAWRNISDIASSFGSSFGGMAGAGAGGGGG